MYWILPAGRGRGAVAEAAERVSRWACNDLGLHRLRLRHAVANPASSRLAAKGGYCLKGTMRSALLREDVWHDEYLPALAGSRDTSERTVSHGP
ncbi:GNAT family N-acetyltransferase [Streptomyces sp. NPDC002073]